MSRSITICETCRYEPTSKEGPDGRRGGAMLAEEVRDYLTEVGRDDVSVRTQRCMWACKRNCTVLFQESENYSYLAGDFRPETHAASDIVAYFDRLAENTNGDVPFEQWPEGVKGHFIARMPPADWTIEGPEKKKVQS